MCRRQESFPTGTVSLLHFFQAKLVKNKQKLFASCPQANKFACSLAHKYINNLCAVGRNRTYIYPLGRDCSIH